MSPRTLRRLAVTSVLVALPFALLFRALVGGDAFVPGDLLSYVAPWSHTNPAPTAAWNVLRYDGITQFYPWRLQAARAFQSGHLPLWNPYAFAASGGAPLLANSQSAPLYPLNALFFDLLPPNLLWYGFGLAAFAQLIIAGTGLYRFLRGLELGRTAALLGATAFALSSPVVTWLALPTFLSVTCWMPWLLLAIRAAHDHAHPVRARRALFGIAAAIGLMLLGGHLQIALYGLLLGGAYALTLGVGNRKTGLTPRRWLAGAAGTLLLGGMLALPQLLPAVELSRVSARAGGDQPYDTYIGTALPARNLVTLLEPDFFGHPNPTDTPYWNTPRSNYAEWALYVGVAPLFLAAFALGLPWKRRTDETPETSLIQPPLRPERAFFAAAASFALLVALGTPLAAVLFFGVPGFRATGSPARILIVFALGVSILAAMGLEQLLRADLPRASKERAALVGIFAPLLVAAFGASQAAQFQSAAWPGTTLAGFLEPVRASLLLGIALVVGAAGILLVAARQPKFARAIGILCVVLTATDLMVRGFGYNPTVRHDQVYAVTPGIAYLQQNVRPDDLIAPIDRSWSMVKEQPPVGAVLPPNALTVYGLHDIGGYDSLFPGADKEQMKNAGEGADPSPPENGNLVFVKTPETALAMGARYLVFAPGSGAAQRAATTLKTAYAGDDLTILENPTPRPFDATVGAAYQPVSFRVGLFAGLAALTAFSAAGTAGVLVKGGRR